MARRRRRKWVKYLYLSLLIGKWLKQLVTAAWGLRDPELWRARVSQPNLKLKTILSSFLLAWRIAWHVAFWLGSIGLWLEEAGHRSLPKRRLSQQSASSCLAHLATLARLMFLRENFFEEYSTLLNSQISSIFQQQRLPQTALQFGWCFAQNPLRKERKLGVVKCYLTYI